MSVFGYFLELSLTSEELIHDMARFEDYGMQSMQASETWPHHYGVMGDGEMHFGFHQSQFSSPSLTFVLQDLQQNMARIRELSIQLEYERFPEEGFHEAALIDAAGTRITLLEARTFSPALPDEDKRCLLGNFNRILLPSTDGNEDLWTSITQASDGWFTTSVDTSDEVDVPTVVYRNDVEELIITAAKEGLRDFTVTQEDQGLIKTAHGFNFLIEDDR